jgi:hypothetical protein
MLFGDLLLAALAGGKAGTCLSVPKQANKLNEVELNQRDTAEAVTTTHSYSSHRTVTEAVTTYRIPCATPNPFHCPLGYTISVGPAYPTTFPDIPCHGMEPRLCQPNLEGPPPPLENRQAEITGSYIASLRPTVVSYSVPAHSSSVIWEPEPYGLKPPRDIEGVDVDTKTYNTATETEPYGRATETGSLFWESGPHKTIQAPAGYNPFATQNPSPEKPTPAKRNDNLAVPTSSHNWAEGLGSQFKPTQDGSGQYPPLGHKPHFNPGPQAGFDGPRENHVTPPPTASWFPRTSASITTKIKRIGPYVLYNEPGFRSGPGPEMLQSTHSEFHHPLSTSCSESTTKASRSTSTTSFDPWNPGPGTPWPWGFPQTGSSTSYIPIPFPTTWPPAQEANEERRSSTTCTKPTMASWSYTPTTFPTTTGPYMPLASAQNERDAAVDDNHGATSKDGTMSHHWWYGIGPEIVPTETIHPFPYKPQPMPINPATIQPDFDGPMREDTIIHEPTTSSSYGVFPLGIRPSPPALPPVPVQFGHGLVKESDSVARKL